VNGKQYRFEKIIDFPLGIGESPVWDDRRQILWFVDILAPAVFSLKPESLAVERYPMPSAVGSLGLTDDSRLLVALRSGVHYFDPTTGALDLLVHPEPNVPINRLNDGKPGPDGCFWVGSMHDAVPRQPSGAFYRVTPEGESTQIFERLHVSNGLAWSPDGRTMYHADTPASAVRAFDFDPESGAVSNGRIFVELGAEHGLPDGAAVDCEGHYWVAGVSAGVVNRIAPNGKVLETIPVPTAAPTMICFGGRDGSLLYVTSLSSRQPDATDPGTLLVCEVDTVGLPESRFGRRRWA
jgi:sugar lactone lactonase YvrE